MKYGYVYKTTNLTTGVVYIGKHKGIFNPSYLGSGILITRAINKYGKHNFKIELISYAKNKENLNKLEIDIIAKYRKNIGKNNLYNISQGGDGGKVYEISPMLGRSHNKKSRKKMSDSHKKRWINPTWDENKRRKKISEVHRNKIVSEATRKLHSDRQKGTTLESRGHTKTCLCSFCKAQRGELKGKISPLRGRKWSQASIQKRTETFKRNRQVKNG